MTLKELWHLPAQLREMQATYKGITDTYYKIELWNTDETLYITPADAILAYAPYIKRVQIGPHAAPGTQLLLYVAKNMGHPNWRGIEFYDHTGADISREMQQAFIDRGLDKE